MYNHMFYTLVSRSIITKINTSRDYLYIFLIGSVGYVILHWYLYKEKQEGLAEKIREYLYYTMVFDALITYVLMIMYPVKSEKPIENTDENYNEESHTSDQKKMIMQKMQDARRMQQMRQKELSDQKCKEILDPTRSNDLPTHHQRTSPEQNQSMEKDTKQHSEKPEDLNDTKKCDDENKNNITGSASQGNIVKKSIFTKSDDSKESNEDTNKETNKESSEKTNLDADIVDKDSKGNKKNNDSKSGIIKNKRVNGLNNKDIVKNKKKESDIEDTEIPVYKAQKNGKQK